MALNNDALTTHKDLTGSIGSNAILGSSSKVLRLYQLHWKMFEICWFHHTNSKINAVMGVHLDAKSISSIEAALLTLHEIVESHLLS